MRKKYVTMQEAGEILQVSYKTLQRKIKDGSLKSRKRGNLREILLDDIGQQADTGTDNDRDSIKTSPKTKKQEVGQSEVGFLREMITKQQGTIGEQNERLAELNKLVLNNQQTLAQLNKTLQLTAGIGTDDLGLNQNDLGQDEDTVKTEKGQSPAKQSKNKPLKPSVRRFNVLTYVLIPLLVIFLVVFGLMYFKVINIPFN